MNKFASFLPQAQKFLEFVNASKTPFHAVDTVSKMLIANGFEKLSEKEAWNVKPNGKYFYTRNQSTIVPFCVGGKYKPGHGFHIVGCHTDSPNLKLKPHPQNEKEGYLQVNVETYGGGLWTTWFDRDLTVAGRVIVAQGNNFVSKLVHIDRPLMRVPTLAIHLNRESGNKLEFNNQTHLLPILSTAIDKQLISATTTDEPPAKKAKTESEAPKKDAALILQLVAESINCKAEDIKDFELMLVDTQPAAIGGAFNEFIFSPRLDNLMMSYCGLRALLDASSDTKWLQEESAISVLVLFDNEEVGSRTAHGAASPIVDELIRRLTLTSQLIEVCKRKSFLISADMAHAVHPNYSEKHEPQHKPKIHGGPVLKSNANGSYTTIAPSSFILRELAKIAGVPVQEFVVRNDSSCGSTIGPIVSAITGIRAVDIGNPQLSMHSIREMCGVSDVSHAVGLLRAFYQQFTTLDEKLVID